MERMTERNIVRDGKYAILTLKYSIQEAISKLAELEDKLENGRLVDCIWFISWVSDAVCHGQVIGYEEDRGFVILSNGFIMNANKIWTNYEDAEKELLKRIKQLHKKEYQEFLTQAEAEKKLKE